MASALLDKRKKYMRSLPCPKDGTSLVSHCVWNGVRYVEGPKGKPLSIWSADLYVCPTCRCAVLTDFAKKARWTNKNTPNLSATIEAEKAKGAVVVCSHEFNIEPRDQETSAEVAIEKMSLHFRAVLMLYARFCEWHQAKLDDYRRRELIKASGHRRGHC